MDLKRLFNALRRRVWFLIILGLLCMGVTAAWVFTHQSPYNYQADTTLYIMNIDKVVQKGQTLNTGDLNFNRTLVQNFGELIKSRRVISEALRILEGQGINYLNEEQLLLMVTLGLQKESNIIVVSAVASDPQTAAAVSNAMSNSFVETLNGLTNSKSIGILDDARPPLIPLPQATRMQKVLVAFIAGLLLGFGIVYLQELLDVSVRSAEHVEQELNIKVMGVIPEHQIK